MECKDCPAINRCQDCGDLVKRAKYLKLKEASMQKAVVIKKQAVPFKVESKKLYFTISSRGLLWGSDNKIILLKNLKNEFHEDVVIDQPWYEFDVKTVDASKIEAEMQTAEKVERITEAEKELQDMQARVAALKSGEK